MKELLKSVEALTEEEIIRDNKTHALFHSPHEGYAVMLEEVDELKDCLTKFDGIDIAMKALWGMIRGDDRNTGCCTKAIKRRACHAAAEAIQVAAMAQKYLDSFEG